MENEDLVQEQATNTLLCIWHALIIVHEPRQLNNKYVGVSSVPEAL